MHPRDVTCVSGRSILLFVNRTLQHLVVATNLSPRVGYENFRDTKGVN